MNRKQLVVDTIRRYPNVPKKTLAKYLVHEYGELFDDDVEKARSAIRRVVGKVGERDLKYADLLDQHEGRLPPSRAKKDTDYVIKDGRYLVMGDLHIPYHEPKPIEAAIDYALNEGIDGIYINGDLQDARAISPWHDVVKREFNKDVEQVIDTLDWLKQTGVKIIYKKGNHEFRLDRLYMSRAAELVGQPLATWEAILGLEERGIDFVEEDQKAMFGKLTVLHGHEIRGRGADAVNPARWLYLKAKDCAIVNHFHRNSAHEEKPLRSPLISTWSLGCMCNLHPHFHKYCNNWNWGFAIISVNGNDFEVDPHKVLENGRVS